ncbi:phage gp6-like head-tail connector protein [Cytobacillus horneckiae]|uniref:phage gp6-like head-tail connector protein n=1 Tax=Cytobacillus horneckiae TaxID=549687 RepID=UPI003B8A9776
MHISHSSEDDNLKRLLSFSFEDIKAKCGVFEIEENKRGKELVFERTRYVYNDALEYFDNNFLSQLTSLGIELATIGGVESETI